MNPFCSKSGKAIHGSKAKAVKAVKRLGNNGSAYHCNICNGFHHSSLTSNEFRTIQRKGRTYMLKKIFDKYRNKITDNKSDDYDFKTFDFQNKNLIEWPSENIKINDSDLQSDDFVNRTEAQVEKQTEVSEKYQSTTGDAEVTSQDTANIIDRSDRFLNRNKSGNHDARSFLNGESRIVKFINQEHYNFGFHTGFNYGSLDAKKTAVDQIIGEFQLLINEAIQLQLEKRAVIQHHLLSIKELPNSVEHAQFEHAVLEANRRIDDLNKEIDLSANQEGIIKKAISQYETGYMKGYREYLDNSDLLCN